MAFEISFQDGKEECPRCKAEVSYRISPAGTFERERAKCLGCGADIWFYVKEFANGSLTVRLLTSGIDYDGLTYESLVGMHRAACSHRDRGDRSRDLLEQIQDLEAAIKRRTWEAVRSINGQESSLGRWTTLEECEEQIRAFPAAGTYEVEGVIQDVRYRIVKHE